MSVLVRGKRDKASRHRRVPATLTALRGSHSNHRGEFVETPSAPRPTPSASSGQHRRKQGPPQDSAMYTCQCGYVFEAQVSTSVDCPHCGDGQAW